MRAHVFWGLALVVPAGLTGCLGADDPADPASLDPTTGLPAFSDAVVHAAGGETLAPADFGAPLPVGIQYAIEDLRVPEPTLGVTSTGTIFLIAGTHVLRSMDKGATWEDVTPTLPTGDTNPPRSNDPYIYVDPDTDRVWAVHQEGLVACYWWTWSDDEGATWDVNPTGCTATVNDHQTVFAAKPVLSPTVGYPNIVYLCNNSVAHNSCIKSIDGGRTFRNTGTPAQLGVIPGEEGIMGTPVCGGLHGHGTPGPDGSLYIGKGACGTPYVLISRDEGLTWEQVVIAQTVTTTHDVDLAMDAAGTLYGVWTGEDELVYMSHSVDQGMTWTAPLLVSAPGVGSTFMPVIAAGDGGHVAIAYVGTRDAEGSPADAPDDAAWHVFIGVTMTADTDEPVFATTRGGAEDEPVHVGPCIGRCGAFVDFIDVVIGPDGRPYVASASCLDECDGASEITSGSLAGGVLVTLTDGPVLKTADGMEHEH